jgi:hypothetical protein
MKQELLKDRQKIEEWLKSVNITDYKITKNFLVNVTDNVYLQEKQLTEIPVQFGTIDGDFCLDDNNLTSLKGSPKLVMGDFSVKNNQLKSLQFCPKEVHRFLIINGNQIKNFKYAPKEVSGDIICIKNPIESLIELKTVFHGTIQYYLKDQPPVPHFEEFYEDNILTLTHEEIKAVQMHTSLSKKLCGKPTTRKLNKI